MLIASPTTSFEYLVHSLGGGFRIQPTSVQCNTSYGSESETNGELASMRPRN